MSASSGEEWGPSPWEPMATADLALLSLTLLHQLVVLCVAVHLVWKRDWPPYVTKNVTLVAATGLGSSLHALGGLVAYGALDRDSGDLLARCGVEALLTSIGMALLFFPACVRVYRNYKVLVRHSVSMWTPMAQLQLVSLPFLLPAITYTLDPPLAEFEDYRNRCIGNTGINLAVFTFMAAAVSVGTVLVARMKAKRVRKQLNDDTVMMTSVAFLLVWVLYLIPTGHWFWDDSPSATRRLAMVDSVVSTAVLFWYPVFVPLLKYIQQDNAYISQFTFGFSKLPTPAQIRASLADDDQLGADDLRRKIRKYPLSRAAPEVSDFLKACIGREKVEENLELQAVTAAMVDRFVVEGGEQEMDISQACRKRVLESELARYNIFDEAITEVLSVMEVDFKADVHRCTSRQCLHQEGQQPPALSKPDSGERPVSGGKAVGTWWPQPPGFGNPVTGREQAERRKEEVVASSPGTGRRVVGGLAGFGGRGSGSRLEGGASLGGDVDCDDDDDEDVEAGVRLERHRDSEDEGGAGRPTSPVRGEKREPRPRPSTHDAAPGMAPTAAAGGGAALREGNQGGVDSRSIVLTSHLRELATPVDSLSATTPTGCVLSPRVSCSADVSAGDGAKASPRSTPAAAAAAPPPPSWGRRDSETGGGADWRYETPPRRPHKQGQGRGRRSRAMPGRARLGGRRVATGISKDRDGGGGRGEGGSASGEGGRHRGIGAKALAEDEGDENGDRSTRTTTADTAVSSDAERGGGRDPFLLPREAAGGGGGGGVAAEPGRGGIEFLLASSSATTEPGAPAVASTPMAPTAVCDRSAFTPATAAARPKSSKPSSRFVSPSRIARFFGGRELWRWSMGGSVTGVESFSDGAGDADADAAATKDDAGISAPCAEGVGVASLIARGGSSWSPARWYTPSSSAASSSAALGRSPAAALSPATAAAAAARGGGAKRHHHSARPLSKKDPETTPPSSRAADIVQTPPMPPLPRRPVPRQWANSHIPLEKPGDGKTEDSPAAKVAADGDDKDGGAATPVPPATQAGAAAAAATDAVSTCHDAEHDLRAASAPSEDRSAAREEEGTEGGERATPPSSPLPLQEVVKARLNSSFNTTASSLGSESSDYYTRLRSFASLLVGCGGGSDRSVSGSPSLLSVPSAVPVPAGVECPSGPPPQDKPKPSSADVPLPVDDASPSEAKKEEEAGEQTAQDRSPSRGSAREAGRANTTGHGHSKTGGGDGSGGGGGEQESSRATSAVPSDRANSPTRASSLRGTTPLASPVRVPPTLWSSTSASSESKRATSVALPPLPSPTAGAAAGSYPSPFENAGCSSGRGQGEEAAQEGASVCAERAALMTAPSFSSAASEESRLSSQPPEASGERCPVGVVPAPVLWPSGSSSSASGTSRQLLAGTTVGDSGLVVGEKAAPSSPTAMAMVAVDGSPLMREDQQWQRELGPLSPRLASIDHHDGNGSTPSPVEDSSWHHQGQREHQDPLPSRPHGEEEPATTPTESAGDTPEREVDPSGGVAMPLSSSPGPPGRAELGSSCGNSSLNNSTNASSIRSGSSEYYTRLRSFAALVGGGGGGDPDSHLDGSPRSSMTVGSAVPQSSPLLPFGCNKTRSRAASSPASGSSSGTAQRRGSTSPHALLAPGPNESMSMPSSLSSTPPPPCRPFDAEAGSETGSSSLSSSSSQAPNETQLTAESLGMVGTTATPKQRTALERNILSFLGVRSGGGGGGGGAGWGSRRSRSSGDGGGGLFRGESFFEDDDVLSRRLGDEEGQRDGAGTGAAAAAARGRAGFDADVEPPMSPVFTPTVREVRSVDGGRMVRGGDGRRRKRRR